ncbi:MAG: HAD-IC family P-type ATPase [Anaerolineales bacterium]|nr:HAD-IC family P-type ATPase [Anaerolineales bacterium]
MNWHTLETTSALSELESSFEIGLTTAQVKTRLQQVGLNQLVEKNDWAIFRILGERLTAPLTLLWLGAGTLALLNADVAGAKWIFGFAFVYLIASFAWQDRPQATIQALKQTASLSVMALRDGVFKPISKPQLVPGDIIQIGNGDTIPADLRLLETVNLRIQEALLTTESGSVEKHTVALKNESLPLWEHSNMAYFGTLVTQGRGLGLVVATGMQTELGKIANLIQKIKPQKTPFRRKTEGLAKTVTAWGVGASILLLAGAHGTGLPLEENLQVSVGLALALVPLGVAVFLPGALLSKLKDKSIRRFSALEALGSVTVVCSDKTGPFTDDRRAVVISDFDGHELDLTDAASQGDARLPSALSLTAIGGSLCNDAKLIDLGDERHHTLGDPTEGALVAAAAHLGYWKSSLDVSFPRAAELPFDSERKRMTTVQHLGQYDPQALAGLDVSEKRYIAFTKGSLQSLLEVASHVWAEGKALEIDSGLRSRIEALNERLIKQGMRVIGVGFRLLNSIPEIIQTDLEQNLTLTGLFGLMDPLRTGAPSAVVACRAAGIRPLLLTGDHPLTALEIARQLGIAENGRALRGIDIETLSVDELKNVIDEVDVFARMAPEHKLKIVQALQARGEAVAITGDSVNDAPALRQADVGIAPGLSGTEIAKEAANLILPDHRFDAMVAAIQTGREALSLSWRLLRLMLAGAVSRFLALGILAFAVGSAALSVGQLLWLGLVDLALGLMMGGVQAAPATPERNPWRWRETLSLGLLMGGLASALGFWRFSAGQSNWQTLVFSALAVMQIVHALALGINRSLRK